MDDLLLLKLMFRRSRILNPLISVGSVNDAIRYLRGEDSGFDVLRWIRTHRGQSPLAVVVLSGSDVQAFRQAYALGADSFLVKPLKFDEFENMVRHVRGIKLTYTPEGHLLELDPQHISSS